MKIDEIRDLVAVQLGVRRVAAVDRLVEDLGADSADVVNLVAAVEDKYDIVKIGPLPDRPEQGS